MKESGESWPFRSPEERAEMSAKFEALRQDRITQKKAYDETVHRNVEDEFQRKTRDMFASRARANKSNSTVGSIAIALCLAAIISPYWIYTGCDSLGFISHTSETTITASQAWLIGEIRQCITLPEAEEVARGSKHNAGYALRRVTCGDEPNHDMSITFFGRKDQPEFSEVMWDCTRKDNTFECRETGGNRK
jgi:hypothetical protein